MPIAQLDAIARQHATSASPDAKRQAIRLPADIPLRVFAMLLVVATHCSYNYHWSPAGRTFFGLFIQNATILFVFVAGMLFKRFAERASYGRYLKQRAKAVMLPYLFMSLPAIAIAIWAPLSTSHLWLHAWPWWEQAGYLLLTGEHLVQMWFMPVMILLILAAPLFRFIDRRHLYWIALPPAFLAATILGRSFAYGFTGVLGMTLHMTPAFLAGMLFERYRSPVEGWCERHLWLLVAAVAAVSAAIVADWDATLNLHLAQKLLLVPLLLILIRKFPPGPRLSALAARLAEVSFAVYLAHYYVLTAFRLGYRSLVLPQLGPGMQALGDSVPGFFLLTAIVLLGTLAAIGAARKLLGRHSRTIIGA